MNSAPRAITVAAAQTSAYRQRRYPSIHSTGTITPHMRNPFAYENVAHRVRAAATRSARQPGSNRVTTQRDATTKRIRNTYWLWTAHNQVRRCKSEKISAENGIQTTSQLRGWVAR